VTWPEFRKLERNMSLGRHRYRWEHRNKSAPGQIAVFIFERTQINSPILVLLEKTATKFCDVDRSGNYTSLFTRVLRGFWASHVGRGRKIFSVLQNATRLALGPYYPSV
jgi:hypothetical protein